MSICRAYCRLDDGAATHGHRGWVADMKPGQRMTFDRIPGTGVRFDINGTVVGTIHGDDFATAFLEIWLGDAPTSPDVKAGLLGGACG